MIHDSIIFLPIQVSKLLIDGDSRDNHAIALRLLVKRQIELRGQE